MRTRWIFILPLLMFTFTGCNSSPYESGEPSAVPSFEPSISSTKVPPGTHLSEFPTQGFISKMVPTMAAPFTPDLQDLIAKAKGDLANRLTISKTQINFVDISEVFWPDSSLGCPQEGKAYAQVLTPGFLIRLEYGNNQYQYHSGKGAVATYCANPIQPLPGIPDSN
jgi:hypothetical protein